MTAVNARSLTRMSVSRTGAQPNNASSAPVISAEGRGPEDALAPLS